MNDSRLNMEDTNDCVQIYCRICASNRPDKCDLFEVIYDGKQLITILEYCLKRSLDTGDYFPHCICSNCFVDLIKTYEFFALIEKSEKWFTTRYSEPNVTKVTCATIELSLAGDESENMLDNNSVKSEHELFDQGIEDTDINEAQNILEIKYECEDDEVTGAILPFLVLVDVMVSHNRCLKFS